ncbi:MAG: hypothetical protein Q4D98_11685 [Planctomycetia bacterium]|nr:hypothetical protein [Planctomycetia bacterium]
METFGRLVGLHLHYGIPLVGKLFLLVGSLFLAIITILWPELSSPGDRPFRLFFVALSGMAMGIGAMMILVSWFLKRPEIPDDLRPTVGTLTSLFRWATLLPLGILVPSFFMLLTAVVLLMDYRDYLPWKPIDSPAIVCSCEPTGIVSEDNVSGDKEWWRYTFTVTNAQGEEITGTSFSSEVFERTVPVEQCGRHYRIQGGTLGVLAGSAGKIFLLLLFFYAFLAVWCLRGFRRLGRFSRELQEPSTSH